MKTKFLHRGLLSILIVCIGNGLTAPLHGANPCNRY
jgi:hypothetical protein